MQSKKIYWLDNNILVIIQKFLGNYKNYRKRAKSQAKHSMNFTLNKMTNVFEDMLGRYLPTFAEEVKLNLPNLGTTEIKIHKLKKVESERKTVEI